MYQAINDALCSLDEALRAVRVFPDREFPLLSARDAVWRVERAVHLHLKEELGFLTTRDGCWSLSSERAGRRVAATVQRIAGNLQVVVEMRVADGVLSRAASRFADVALMTLADDLRRSPTSYTWLGEWPELDRRKQ